MTAGAWIGAVLAPSAFPDVRLLVGLEDDPDDNSLMVYVGARYRGIHTHLPADSEEARKLRKFGWSAHTFVEVPAAALCDCHPELTEALRPKEATG